MPDYASDSDPESDAEVEVDVDVPKDNEPVEDDIDNI